MRKLELLEDFATHKKGDVIELNSVIAASLVSRKAAKPYKPKKKTKK